MNYFRIVYPGNISLVLSSDLNIISFQKEFIHLNAIKYNENQIYNPQSYYSIYKIESPSDNDVYLSRNFNEVKVI